MNFNIYKYLRYFLKKALSLLSILHFPLPLSGLFLLLPLSGLFLPLPLSGLFLPLPSHKLSPVSPYSRMAATENEPGRVRLDAADRARVGAFLLQHQDQENGRTALGFRKEAALLWGVSVRSISRLAELQRKQIQNGEVIDLRCRTKGKKSSNEKLILDKDAVVGVPLQHRCTQRRFARAMNVSLSTMHRWIKNGELISHSNAIKPQMTDAHRLRRLHYSISHLVHDTLDAKTKFRDMHHIIHIDEKWFFVTRVSERYYLLPEEMEPHRTVENKKYLKKIMFLCAVCRPIIDDEGQVMFDGKIGIWPFSEEKAAKKWSRNRDAGTIEIKPITSIDRDVTKKFMLEKLVPAIKRKWPLIASTNIFIQQDNAKPHILDDDPDFRQAASSDGFNIRLGFQPPKSPDLNVLDLGFFRAIQSLQHQTASYTIPDLIRATEDAFESLHATTLNKVFLTLQSCMVEIMKNKGSNKYKVSHMHKDALHRQGELPKDLEVDNEIVRECLVYLQHANATQGLHHMIQQFEELPTQ